jgi:uncharacterized membrane protein
MWILIIGLLLFLGVHSVRIAADGWRSAQIVRLGAPAWKGLFSVASAIGLMLVIWGFGQARQQPVLLWAVPLWTRHLAGLLVLIAFVLLAAAYVPANAFKARLHHPMILGVKLWAFAHLLANGRLADVVLFGSFLLWAIADFAASRRRDRRLDTVYAAGTAGGTALAVVVGVAAWAVFAFVLHGALIGVRPFG